MKHLPSLDYLEVDLDLARCQIQLWIVRFDLLIVREIMVQLVLPQLDQIISKEAILFQEEMYLLLAHYSFLAEQTKL